MPATVRHPARQLPSRELRDEWAATAKAAGRSEKAYVNKWRRRWIAVLEVLLELDEFEDEHLWLLEQFIESLRLAEHHQREARKAGYHQTDAGRHFAHPGFDKARDCRREARDIGAQLLLTPKALREAGLASLAHDDDDADDEHPPPASDQAGL